MNLDDTLRAVDTGLVSFTGGVGFGMGLFSGWLYRSQTMKELSAGLELAIGVNTVLPAIVLRPAEEQLSLAMVYAGCYVAGLEAGHWAQYKLSRKRSPD
jgi:uncharacterized membrane protein YfcA